MFARITLLLILLVTQLISFAQNLPAEIIVKINCSFNDGIYLNFSQFTSNHPTPFSYMATDKNPKNHSTIADYMSQRNIFLIDSLGNTTKIKTSSIWGYCFHCSIYVNVGGIFYLLPRINTLALLPEKIPEAWFSKKVEQHEETNEGEYGYFQTYENIEVVVDMRDGNIHRFEPEVLVNLIEPDSTLANEYSSLSARKQKKRKLQYFNRFNQRNPLNLHNGNTN